MTFIFPILIPVIGSVAVFLTRTNKTRRILVFSVMTAAVISAVVAVVGNAEDIVLLDVGSFLSIRFGTDKISAFFAITFSVIFWLVQFFAFDYMEHEGNESQFYGFYCLSYASLIALATSKNAVTFYMCFELMSIVSMPLVLHNGSQKSRLAAFKYLGYSTLGAALALFGFFILAGCAENLDFVIGGIKFASGTDRLLLIAYLLIVVGFGCKAGIVPLQMWLTEAHPVAPSPASAVLSGIITKAGILAIIRTSFFLLNPDILAGSWAVGVLEILSIVTIFFGSMLALHEKLLKKRLAYSTISQASYVLFGIFLMNENAFAGAMLQVVFHALAKDVLFLAAGAIIALTGATTVDATKGLGRKMPVTMWCFAIAALSLIGIPPAGGFISKWQLAIGALQSGSFVDFVGLLVLMVSALLTAFYLLPLVSSAFFPGRTYEDKPGGEAGIWMLAPMIVMAALILILGMLPGGLMTWLNGLAASLF